MTRVAAWCLATREVLPCLSSPYLSSSALLDVCWAGGDAQLQVELDVCVGVFILDLLKPVRIATTGHMAPRIFGRNAAAVENDSKTVPGQKNSFFFLTGSTNPL